MKTKKIDPGQKEATRKLTLARETLRRLANEELEQVAGGFIGKSKLLTPVCTGQDSVLEC